MDQRLLATISPHDLTRRRWIERAPNYLRDARTSGRWVWLTEEEERTFRL